MVAEDLLEDLLEEIKKDIISELRAQGRYASGQTEQLFEVRLRSTGGMLEGVLLGPDYIQALITGRGPTLRGGGGGETLQQKLLSWIITKGIGSPKEQESISWAMAVHIHKFGNLLYQRGGDTGLLKNIITESRVNATLGLIADDAKTEIIKGFNETLVK